MADVTLNAQTREIIGKQVNRLRRVGEIPATLYGPAVDAPRSLQVDAREFDAVYRQIGITKALALTINGGSSQSVVVKGVQYNMLRRRVDHIDFYAGK